MTRWWDRVRALHRSRWNGTTGPPPSGNGASSFHLFWHVPSGEWVGAEAVVEIAEAPTVPRLYFWALQVSFTDRGRRGGGAHLGLQWHPAHPGATAVNWGGYGADGRELTGTTSSLPSATGNVNTRDFDWKAGCRYRLRISSSGEANADGLYAWQGDVLDESSGVETTVRGLWAPGDRLTDAMVWSEVFADCDAPGVAVRWRGFTLVGADATEVPVRSVTVNYQSLAEGGCTNTDTVAEDDAFVQVTATERHCAQGTRLTLR